MAADSLIVTGIPRSGTTLVCSLISQMRNAYCLSEPMEVDGYIRQAASADEFLLKVSEFFEQQRRQIIESGAALNRADRSGDLSSNYFRRNGSGQIEDESLIASVQVDVENDDFTLAVKHNAHFLAVLPRLIALGRYQVFSVIRHPVPTILSWQSLRLPVSSGRLPAAENLWPAVREIAQSPRELMVKQVLLYETLMTRILECRQGVHIISYEKLVADPAQLCVLMNQSYRKPVTLNSQNENKHYDWSKAEALKEALTAYAPNTMSVYPRLDDTGARAQL
jgi:hypothetical protein